MTPHHFCSNTECVVSCHFRIIARRSDERMTISHSVKRNYIWFDPLSGYVGSLSPDPSKWFSRHFLSDLNEFQHVTLVRLQVNDTTSLLLKPRVSSFMSLTYERMTIHHSVKWNYVWLDPLSGYVGGLSPGQSTILIKNKNKWHHITFVQIWVNDAMSLLLNHRVSSFMSLSHISFKDVMSEWLYATRSGGTTWKLLYTCRQPLTRSNYI